MIVKLFEHTNRSFNIPKGNVSDCPELVAQAVSAGWAIINGNKFYLTDKGKNELVLAFKEAKDYADAVLLFHKNEYTSEPSLLILVSNPKRPGSAAHAGYACYMDGMTLEEAVEAMEMIGISRSLALKNINWDTKKGFISFQ